MTKKIHKKTLKALLALMLMLAMFLGVTTPIAASLTDGGEAYSSAGEIIRNEKSARIGVEECGLQGDLAGTSDTAPLSETLEQIKAESLSYNSSSTPMHGKPQALSQLETLESSRLTIRFYVGEKLYHERQIQAGETVLPPEAPPNEIWPEGMVSFRGWFKAGMISSFNFDLPIENDINLYAGFSNEFLIQFRNADGIVVLSRSAASGEKLGYEAIAEIRELENRLQPPGEGQIFTRWLREDTQKQFDTDNTIIVSDVTLVPSFSTAHNVFFVSVGSFVPAAVVSDDSIVAQPANPTRTGWEFSHWSLTENGRAAFDFNTQITSDIILHAVWANPHYAEYTVVIWVEKPNVIGDPGTDRSNYMFYTSLRRTGTNMRLAGTMADYTNQSALPAANRVISATTSTTGNDSRVWAVFRHGESLEVQGDGTTVVNVFLKRLEFTFNFELGNPGTNNTTNRRARSITFTDGRSNSGPFGRGITTEGANLGSQAISYSFRAKYEQDIWNQWPSSHNAVIIDTHRTRANQNALWNEAWASNHFRGWPAASNISSGDTFVSHRPTVTTNMIPSGSAIDRSVTFTATWGTVNERRAEYWFEALPGEAAGDRREMIFGARRYIESPYSQDINISGTTLNPRTFTGLTHTGNSHEGVIFRFFYIRNRYTLSFNSMGGTAVAPIHEVMFGENIESRVSRAAPTRTANGIPMRFAGWYLDAEHRIPVGNEAMPNGPLTLFARWVSTELEVYFQYERGVFIPDSNLTTGRGERLHVPDMPFQIGQSIHDRGVLLGWQRVFPNNTVVLFDIFSTQIHENITLRAVWQVNDFRVTYNIDPGIGTTPIDLNGYDFGTQFRIADAAGFIPQSGYLFVGWSEERYHGIVFFPGTTARVTGDFNFRAWYIHETRIDDYFVMTFRPNFETPQTPLSHWVLQNQQFPLGATALHFARLGYDKVGWSTDPYGTVDFEFTGSVLIDGDITLYAVWERDESRWAVVTYTSGEHGTFDKEEHKVLINSETPIFGGSLTANPGWHFERWDPIWSLLVAGDIDYVALWAPNTDIIMTVNHFLSGTSTPVANSETRTGLTMDTIATAYALNIQGFTVVGEKMQTLRLAAAENVITFFYAEDTTPPSPDNGNCNGNGDNPEETPTQPLPPIPPPGDDEGIAEIPSPPGNDGGNDNSDNSAEATPPPTLPLPPTTPMAPMPDVPATPGMAAPGVPAAPTVPALTTPAPLPPLAPIEPAEEEGEEIIIIEEAPPLAAPTTIPEMQLEQEADDEGIVAIIDNDEIPLGPSGGYGNYWALWNLILSIAGTVFALMIGIRVLTKKRQNRGYGGYARQMSENADATAYTSDTAARAKESKRRNRLLIFATPLLAMLGIILFIFTQDMSRQMTMTDMWTFAHMVLLAGGIVSYILAYGSSEEDREGRGDTRITTA